MDSSWLEILPLPKSRPGWMAAIFLTILSVIPWWYVYPSLSTYVQNTYYTTAEGDAFGVLGAIVQTPVFVEESKPYVAKIILENWSREEVKINSVRIKKSEYSYYSSNPPLEKWMTISLDSVLLPHDTIEVPITFSVPYQTNNKNNIIYGSEMISLSFTVYYTIGDRDQIIKEIVFSSVTPEPPYSLRSRLGRYYSETSSIYMVVDRWSVLQANVFQTFIVGKYTPLFIFLVVLLSVWLTEYKNHQDLWLSTKEGWNSVRKIFLISAIKYFSLIFVFLIAFSFTQFIGWIVVFVLVILFLGWLLQPEISQLLSKLKQRKVTKVNDRNEMIVNIDQPNLSSNNKNIKESDTKQDRTSPQANSDKSIQKDKKANSKLPKKVK